jgi:hypothetical protein
MEHKLEVDVHAHWSDTPPVYRIYVNNEMLVERTFGWPSYQIYLIEHMFCDLDTGVHTLTLENLDTNSRFELENLKINNHFANKNLLKNNGAKAEWRFIVDLENKNSYGIYYTVKADQVSKPTPLAPSLPAPTPVQKPSRGTNLALVQRMRELNNRAAKK